MAQANIESVKRDIWFWYFTEILYNTGTIEKEKREKIEKTLFIGKE